MKDGRFENKKYGQKTSKKTEERCAICNKNRQKRGTWGGRTFIDKDAKREYFRFAYKQVFMFVFRVLTSGLIDIWVTVGKWDNSSNLGN